MSYSVVDRLLIYAIVFIETGDILKASLVLNRALKYAPLNANAWYLKAFTHSQYEVQKHALLTALTHDSTHQLARENSY